MSDYAIRLENVSKMYKLFATRNDNLLDALGFSTFLPGRARKYREFWAVRDVSLDLPRGQRIGIIGRNGAGKTTLLKLITHNISPTEGRVDLGGDVYALMDAGAGFHPEFTGYENIRASLAYRGFGRHALRAAIEDIADFTELGSFLEQPYKTYSLGMQARLAFATATAVRPEILVIDEILGAGDAYFVAKSLERIRELTDGGASMLIVSHSMAQITQLCAEAIWLDRGRVIERGPSLDVVRAYEGHIRELDDRRIQERNRKRRTGVATDRLDESEASVIVEVRVEGKSGATVEVSEVALVRDGRRSEAIEVGAPQDADATHAAYVLLDNFSWSAPRQDGGRYLRAISTNGAGTASGAVGFNLLRLDPDSRYEIDLEYRTRNAAAVTLVGGRFGAPATLATLEPAEGAWQRIRHRVDLLPDEVEAEQADTLSHWPGDGTLRITDVALLNAAGQPCAIFEPGDDLSVEIRFEPIESASFRFLPAVVIYRLDGVNISTQLGSWTSAGLEVGHIYHARTTLRGLNLGNGTYLASPVLYKVFDQYLVEEPVVYDWIDRGIEFQVVGTPPAINSVFQHPSVWTIGET